MATTLIAVAAMARCGISLRLLAVRISARVCSLYLGVVLVLCKSVAAAVEGIALSLLLLFTSLRTAMRCAVLMAALALFYPAVRIADLMPLEQIVAVSDALDPSRAKSLNFRFESEEAMLAKARERFLFGWGGYRRAWVFDEETGENITVPDGYWIIQLGGRGLVGFLTAYALYTIPVFRAGRSLRRVSTPLDRTLLVTLALVAPRLLVWPNRAWTALAHVLGFVSTRVILGVLFVVMMTPLGWLMRLRGWDPLARRSTPRESYWVPYPERHRDPR
jgi:hypothetical protein